MSVCVCFATKSARVKVLVLVYELNVKLTYFKSPARTTAAAATAKRAAAESEIGRNRDRVGGRGVRM